MARREKERELCAVIVDDSAAVRSSLSEILDANGVSVVAVPTLARAYVAIERVRPDVVILSLDLAGGAAENLLDDLAATTLAVPGVVVMSIDPARLARTAAAYAVPVLTQPFEANVVAATVRVAGEQRIQPRKQRRA